MFRVSGFQALGLQIQRFRADFVEDCRNVVFVFFGNATGSLFAQDGRREGAVRASS